MHPGMTLINLKFFCDTAQRLSVSEAAQVNGVTQSAISQGIRKLEKALKTELTNHHRHNLQLTQEGKTALEKGKNILRSFKELEQCIQEQSKTISGTVSVGCTPSLAMNFMNKTILLMRREYPEVVVEPKIGDPESLRRWIKTDAVDLGLALASPAFASFEQTVLRRGTFTIFSSSSRLQDGVFVDNKDGLLVDLFQDQYRRKHKKELPILAELGSWELVAQFASDSIGCGILPDYLGSLYSSLKPEQTIKPLAYELVACTNKAVILSRAAKAFFHFFSEVSNAEPCFSSRKDANPGFKK